MTNGYGDSSPWFEIMKKRAGGWTPEELAVRRENASEFKRLMPPGVRNQVDGGVLRVVPDTENDLDGTQGLLKAELTDYGKGISQEMRDQIATGEIQKDPAKTIELFTQGLTPEYKDLVDQSILAVTVDPDTGVPYLIKGAMASLLPEAALNKYLTDALGLPAGAPPGLAPAEAAAIRLEEAALLGRLDGAPTLEREAFEAQLIRDREAQALDVAGLLGTYMLDGEARETLEAESIRGRLGLEAQDIAQRGALTREGFAVDRERLALDQLLGQMGMGLRGDELALQELLGLRELGLQGQDLALREAVGMGNLALGQGGLAEQIAARQAGNLLDRRQLDLNQGSLMGFMRGVPTLETGIALGEIGGRQTLDAKQLALNKAAQDAEWIRNPSNFIAAQLLRGGPGTTVGLTIPGRIAETLYGGQLPNPSQVGYGAFGPGQLPLQVPSLQTLNQLNPDELQAVAAAAPFVTGGMVTPTQYFGDAAYQGLRAF